MTLQEIISQIEIQRKLARQIIERMHDGNSEKWQHNLINLREWIQKYKNMAYTLYNVIIEDAQEDKD